MGCVKVSIMEWDSIRPSDRLLIEVPGWLAREKGVEKTAWGFVSFQSRKAVWFVVSSLKWAGWLPKSQVHILEVTQ